MFSFSIYWIKNCFIIVVLLKFRKVSNSSHVTCNAKFGYPAPTISWRDSHSRFIPQKVKWNYTLSLILDSNSLREVMFILWPWNGWKYVDVVRWLFFLLQSELRLNSGTHLMTRSSTVSIKDIFPSPSSLASSANLSTIYCTVHQYNSSGFTLFSQELGTNISHLEILAGRDCLQC